MEGLSLNEIFEALDSQKNIRKHFEVKNKDSKFLFFCLICRYGKDLENSISGKRGV